MKRFSPVLVRTGLGLVLLWFGISQIVTPEMFLGYLPAYVTGFGFDAGLMILLNGVLDALLGVLLLVGLFTRITAFVVLLHLVHIVFALGYNDIAVRDVGLSFMALAVLVYGPDMWSVDRRMPWSKE